MPTEGEPISKPLGDKRGFWVKWHDVEFLALNFPSNQDKEILAKVALSEGGFEYKAGTIGEWLVLAHRKDIGTVPYDVFAGKAAEALSVVSGSRVDPASILLSLVSSKVVEDFGKGTDAVSVSKKDIPSADT